MSISQTVCPSAVNCLVVKPLCLPTCSPSSNACSARCPRTLFSATDKAATKVSTRPGAYSRAFCVDLVVCSQVLYYCGCFSWFLGGVGPIFSLHVALLRAQFQSAPHGRHVDINHLIRDAVLPFMQCLPASLDSTAVDQVITAGLIRSSAYWITYMCMESRWCI